MSGSGLSKYVGSVLILAGTAIGAGMLALPLVSAQIGFPVMVLLLLVTGGAVIIASQLTLEANLAIEPGSCLYTMASRTLGRAGGLLAILSPLILFYSLLAAYLSGGGSLIYQYLGSELTGEFGPQISVILFAVFAAIFVYCSTRSVDLINRILFLGMLVALAAAVLSLMPAVESQNLVNLPKSELAILAAVPIIFTSFGFHGSIPSVILYLKSDRGRGAGIFILGTLLPLLVYSIWLAASMGVLPGSVLSTLSQNGSSVGGLVGELSATYSGNRQLSSFLHIFSDLALLTSLLGVALGLFDYLASILSREDSRTGRFQTTLVTFTPPVVFALCYPEGFVIALGYASIALAILAILLPTAMVIKIRKKTNNLSSNSVASYKAPGGVFSIYFCFAFGCLVIVVQLLVSSGVISG